MKQERKWFIVVVMAVIMASFFATSVSAHHAEIYAHADCNGYEVWAYYHGGDQQRRVVVDVQLWVDGVLENIDSDETLIHPGKELFRREGSGNHTIDVEGYVRLYVWDRGRWREIQEEEFIYEYRGKCTPTASPSPTSVPPTNVPTDVPTSVPTSVPTDIPTNVPTGIPTNVPTNAPTDVPPFEPTSLPTLEPSPIPPDTSPYVPYSWCVIVGSNTWDVDANNLSVNGYPIISRNSDGYYVIFYFNSVEFPVGSTIPIELNGELWLVVTVLPGNVCGFDGNSPPNDNCAEGCPEHKDEILVQDEHGGWSMTALLWTDDGGKRIAVSTAPFSMVCPNGNVSVDQVFNHSDGLDYYQFYGDPSCIPDISMADYGPCVLTPDLTHRYWYRNGEIFLYYGQAPSEIYAALSEVGIEEEILSRFMNSWAIGSIHPFVGQDWLQLQ